MVLEEGLDMSCLPLTLKEDFDQLDRLEGQYRVTSFLTEDLEDYIPCGFCNVKRSVKQWTKLVEEYKPMITFSKVILVTDLNIYEIKN